MAQSVLTGISVYIQLLPEGNTFHPKSVCPIGYSFNYAQHILLLVKYSVSNKTPLIKTAAIPITEKTMKKILALILALGTVLSLVACKKDKTPESTPTPEPTPEVLTPLYKMDLSEYIELDSSLYKSITVEIKPNEVSDLDVNNYIIQILCSNKNKTALEEGDGIITVGDVVNIFYKGYYLTEDENGEEKRVYFDGGSNVGSSSYALEIGSGGFIPGFEYNMISKNAADYDSENPMIVEAYFPENYGVSELNGKTAYFEVFVARNEDGSFKMTEYSAPELNEDFIKSTLKFTDEILAEYDGETVEEKYVSYIRHSLEWDGISAEEEIWNAFWETVFDAAVIKKYPEKHVDKAYNEIVEYLDSLYAYYSVYYTYDQLACMYFGLASGSDWKPAARAAAEDQIKQYLIFYYVMDVEGLDPTPEEYEVLFDEYLTDALKENGVTEDKFNTEEEFLEHKKQYKAQMLLSKGEEYFEEIIYFSLGYDAIIEYAEVVGEVG